MIIRRLSLEDAEWLQMAIKTRMPAALGYGFDASEWLTEERNIALASGEDIALFEAGDFPHFYQAHWAFEAQGKAAFGSASAILKTVFDDFGALMLWGWTPIFCQGARWFNRQVGAISKGVHETDNGPQELFCLERSRWVSSKARRLRGEQALPPTEPTITSRTS